MTSKRFSHRDNVAPRGHPDSALSQLAKVGSTLVGVKLTQPINSKQSATTADGGLHHEKNHCDEDVFANNSVVLADGNLSTGADTTDATRAISANDVSGGSDGNASGRDGPVRVVTRTRTGSSGGLHRSHSTGCQHEDALAVADQYMNPATLPHDRITDTSTKSVSDAKPAAESNIHPSATSCLSSAIPPDDKRKKSSVQEVFGRIPHPFKTTPKPRPSEQSDKIHVPTSDQVRQWCVSMDAVLHSSVALTQFRDFLQLEHSNENIDFWTACEEYKRIEDADVLRDKASEIYETFVAVQSIHEVNLDAGTRAHTLEAVKSPTHNTFEPAVRKILALMEKDSYPRFAQWLKTYYPK